eukprot:CAMPEP_0197912148 /NCGR_PEP_ID=MMETSP1439-20131203/74223_1 /TAXON_ID=66791 /ORGANISM="Gonyaulax spinifera, Strain CCMP409" /LENGTH=130 /DNA_ID=CAMNT_0043533919 /DNA_START=277 /DNA_END=670 /DNA_ORIENTATION=+
MSPTLELALLAVLDPTHEALESAEDVAVLGAASVKVGNYDGPHLLGKAPQEVRRLGFQAAIAHEYVHCVQVAECLRAGAIPLNITKVHLRSLRKGLYGLERVPLSWVKLCHHRHLSVLLQAAEIAEGGKV